MDTKKIRKQYTQFLPKLKEVLQHVQSQLADLPPNDFSLETNLKPYPSIKQKLLHDNSDLTQLSDLARGRIYFSEQFNFNDIIDIIKQLFPDQISKIDKKTRNTSQDNHCLEYHGIMHIDLNINDVNFELQLLPMEYKPYKELLHQIYSQFKDHKNYDKMNDDQRKALCKIHNNLSKKLHIISTKNRK